MSNYPSYDAIAMNQGVYSQAYSHQPMMYSPQAHMSYGMGSQPAGYHHSSMAAQPVPQRQPPSSHPFAPASVEMMPTSVPPPPPPPPAGSQPPQQQQQRNSNKRGGHAAAAQSDSQQPLDINAHHNLFVACLPRNLTDNDLHAIFKPYNPIRATIMMDVNCGRSKGFGFVLFGNGEDGYQACTQLNNKRVTACGTTFTMHVSASKHDGFAACAESPCVYFRNVPENTTIEEIERVFEAYGPIQHAESRLDPIHGNLLVSVEYTTVESARTAIAQAHGKVLFPNQAIPTMARFAENYQAKVMRKKKKIATAAPQYPPAPPVELSVATPPVLPQLLQVRAAPGQLQKQPPTVVKQLPSQDYPQDGEVPYPGGQYHSHTISTCSSTLPRTSSGGSMGLPFNLDTDLQNPNMHPPPSTMHAGRNLSSGSDLDVENDAMLCKTPVSEAGSVLSSSSRY